MSKVRQGNKGRVWLHAATRHTKSSATSAAAWFPYKLWLPQLSFSSLACRFVCGEGVACRGHSSRHTDAALPNL